MAAKKETNRPVALEGRVLMATPTPQLKLATIEDCRREMARVYRDARNGRTESADASRFVYMLTSIAKLIEVSQLEMRLKALEEIQNGKL